LLNADDIKIKFIAWILQNDQDAIIGHEVLYSQNQRRADLVVIKQDLMYALEIKSDIDTINRLNDQIKDYLSTFDFVSVITTSKHIKEIRSKLNKKVGILVVSDNDIKIIRRPKRQKRLSKQNLCEFLSRQSLLKLLKKKGISRFSMFELRKLATQLICLNDLRKEAISTLYSRYKILFELFRKDVKHQEVSKDDLISLTGNIKSTKLF